MMLLFVLLFVWLTLTVLGFVIKGLLWLALIGIILFVITGMGTVVKYLASPRD